MTQMATKYRGLKSPPQSVGTNQFLGYINGATAVGNFTTNQILNPAGSGKLCIIDSILMRSTAAGTSFVNIFMNSGSTLSTAVTAAINANVESIVTDTDIELRTEALAGGASGTVFRTWTSNAASTTSIYDDLRLKNQIILHPGFSIIFQILTANTAITTIVEYTKVDA